MRYAQLAQYLGQVDGTLLGMDMRELVQAGLPPADLFRLLRHPRQLFEEMDQIAMEFRRGEPIDYLLITQEDRPINASKSPSKTAADARPIMVPSISIAASFTCAPMSAPMAIIRSRFCAIYNGCIPTSSW